MPTTFGGEPKKGSYDLMALSLS
ncbi:hypothetical protein [Staphylococcus aureus]